MKVAGFTFIRNGIKFDYPFIEAIQSILPLCDKVYVALGQSEDNTKELIQAMNEPKLIVIPTIWDDSLREGGKVLAVETNKAFDGIPAEYDWCIYIQGDEVLPDESLEVIKAGMTQYLHNPEVEGLLLQYLHFYGTYKYIADSANWYRREIRIIRNDKAIRSYKDAQGFRKNGQKLKAKLLSAYIHHYGWVKSPQVMLAKQKEFNKLWHDESWIQEAFSNLEVFDYSGIDSIKEFSGNYPKIMEQRILAANWALGLNPTQKKISIKNKFRQTVEQLTGIRLFEYKNYKII